MTASRRLASVDIGSNSVLMLVVDHTPDGFVKVDDLVAVPRISQGLDASGVLAEPAIARVEAVLAELRAHADALGVDAMVATGTAPFRRSGNGADVAERLGAALGARIDIVTGEHEAELSLLATRRAFAELDRFVVVDIGGASTEVIVVDGDRVQSTSLDIGSVRLTERCVEDATRPLAARDRRAIDAAIDAAFDDHRLGALVGDGQRPLIGIAGTVTTVATVSLELDEWDDEKVHGLTLTRDEVRRIADALPLLTATQRAALPGLPAPRADVLPAGTRLLWRLIDACDADGVTVSDRGTRWGRLHEVFGTP